MYLLTQTKNGMAALELSRHLGVCYRTAWRIKHKVMEAMATRDATQRLGGIVQIDDAYLGGECPGGRAGTGVPGARWVNVVLGNLKRSLDGTLHAFKYTQRYLADATWRFNRRFELKALVRRLLVAAARYRPWPEPALRDCEVWARC